MADELDALQRIIEGGLSALEDNLKLKTLADKIYAILQEKFELDIIGLCKLLPEESGVDLAVAYAMLVEAKKVIPIYRLTGVDRPFFDMKMLLDYWEANNLPKNIGTSVSARIIRTSENTPHKCLDCGGPFPPAEKDCDDYCRQNCLEKP